MARRAEIEAFMQALLQPERFKDYGPNGLQVEGRAEIGHIVSGVTASRAFIDEAIAAGAQAIVVHHGLFWRGHDGRLTGWLKERVSRLLAADVSLFAYHLPLDAHAEVGNNAQFGQRAGFVPDGRFGDQELGFVGALPPAMRLDTLQARLQTLTQRAPVAVPGDGRPLQRVAWCTGGAQGWFEAAIAAGADVYVTGEISEPQAHIARETGVAFIACGHHATERYGAPALAETVARRFGLEHRFIDVDNPA